MAEANPQSCECGGLAPRHRLKCPRRILHCPLCNAALFLRDAGDHLCPSVDKSQLLSMIVMDFAWLCSATVDKPLNMEERTAARADVGGEEDAVDARENSSSTREFFGEKGGDHGDGGDGDDNDDAMAICSPAEEMRKRNAIANSSIVESNNLSLAHTSIIGPPPDLSQFASIWARLSFPSIQTPFSTNNNHHSAEVCKCLSCI